MNQLVLTDEEDAKNCAFKTMISTHDEFRLSTVMLCTFHAVLQPFKWDIYNLMPSNKSPKGSIIELIDVEKARGEYFYLIYQFLSL
jgi:hypothetical protein